MVEGSRDDPSDGELFVRMSHGDEDAYRILIRRHEARLFRYALLRTQSVADAEEVTGTVLHLLWQKRRHVRIVNDSTLPWLLRTTNLTAKNQLRAYHRYRRLIRKIPYEGDCPDHADAVAAAMDSLKVTEEVRDALAELSQQDSDVLILCVIQELSMREAAVAIGIPEGTVKSRLSRVKARLRTRLAHHDPTARVAES